MDQDHLGINMAEYTGQVNDTTFSPSANFGITSQQTNLYENSNPRHTIDFTGGIPNKDEF